MSKVILKTIANLQKGKTILYPTDTIWGLGCDATNNISVKKIYALKQRKKSKNLIVLMNSFEMLEEYVKFVPQKVRNYLEQHKEDSITVIYSAPINLATSIIAEDNTIAVRIVKEGLVNRLITEFGKPIVSTSANISNEKSPENYLSINPIIIKNVDYIVQSELDTISNSPSKIIKFERNEIIVLRD